ncbi:uncharacterized protein LOC144094825 [Amblyomma americanum]
MFQVLSCAITKKVPKKASAIQTTQSGVREITTQILENLILTETGSLAFDRSPALSDDATSRRRRYHLQRGRRLGRHPRREEKQEAGFERRQRPKGSRQPNQHSGDGSAEKSRLRRGASMQLLSPVCLLKFTPGNATTTPVP